MLWVGDTVIQQATPAGNPWYWPQKLSGAFFAAHTPTGLLQPGKTAKLFERAKQSIFSFDFHRGGHYIKR
jgi:hypothetical protein